MPFSVGVGFFEAFENNDKKIIYFFDELEYILSYMGKKKKIDLDHDLYLQIKGEEEIYTYSVTKKDSDIIFDASSNNGYLRTNMFSMKENKEYYYSFHENVIVSGMGDYFSCGTIIDFNVLIAPIEEKLNG